MDDTIVSYSQVSMVNFGRELGRSGNQSRLVSWLFPCDNLLSYAGGVFCNHNRAESNFVISPDAELELVAHHQVLDIGLTMAHVVEGNVPIALWSRSLVALFHLSIKCISGQNQRSSWSKLNQGYNC